MHFTSLVRVNQVSHGLYLRIVLVRLGFLTVEGVDLTPCEHVGEDEVLEDLDTLRGTCFVVVAERFEKIFACAIPLTWGDRLGR